MAPTLDTVCVVPNIGTMSRNDKTLEQIRQRNGGLHWSKVQSLLRNLGGEFTEGRPEASGSRSRDDGSRFTVRTPVRNVVAVS